MKLFDVPWHPSSGQLRQFAVICLVALPLLGWFWDASSLVFVVLVVIAAAIGIGGLGAPQTIKPVFLALMIMALPIGMVIGEVAMLAIYFGVFFPIGMAFRLIGRDELKLKIERDAPTYWQVKKRPKGLSSYYRQS